MHEVTRQAAQTSYDSSKIARWRKDGQAAEMEEMVDGHDERGHEKKRDRSTKHDLRALELSSRKYV